MAKRSPLKVLLFLILLLVVAYLCKRGWEGFYDASTGVYCIGEVGSGGDAWATRHYAGGHWIRNAPPLGNGVCWIWGAPNSGNESRPDNEAFTFYNSYNNTTGSNIQAQMYGGADNYATVTINGEQFPRFDGSLSSPYSVTLRPGNNNIQIFGQNGVASPSAVWLMIKDTSGRILIKTDSTSGWSTSPLPPPPAAAAPAAACPACPACADMSQYMLKSSCNSCSSPNACVNMAPYMLRAKCLMTDDDTDPPYMLIEDCKCPTCKEHRQS